MTCRRNLVMQDLQQRYNDLLPASFNVLSRAIRDLSQDPSGTPPEATPACWIEEQGSLLQEDEDNVYCILEIHAVLNFKVAASADNRGLPQDLINEVEAIADTMFDRGLTVEGVNYVVAPDGFRATAAGVRGQALMEFPIIVRFRRETLFDS